jgi:ABC-type glycerol-3-phosphate transport system permease component
VSEQKKQSRWKIPLGLMATGLAGAAVFVFRGCWHKKMSWPIRVQQHSYQVCLNCGIKRLFDEQSFRAYGPYSYDLQRLVAWDRKRRASEVAAKAGKQPA